MSEINWDKLIEAAAGLQEQKEVKQKLPIGGLSLKILLTYLDKLEAEGKKLEKYPKILWKDFPLTYRECNAVVFYWLGSREKSINEFTYNLLKQLSE